MLLHACEDQNIPFTIKVRTSAPHDLCEVDVVGRFRLELGLSSSHAWSLGEKVLTKIEVQTTCLWNFYPADAADGLFYY